MFPVDQSHCSMESSFYDWRGALLIFGHGSAGKITLDQGEGTLPLLSCRYVRSGGRQHLCVFLLPNRCWYLPCLSGRAAALLVFWIEFITQMRKRKERIDLSLEDEVASSLRPRVAGMDALLSSIADLIHRARNPAAYQAS